MMASTISCLVITATAPSEPPNASEPVSPINTMAGGAVTGALIMAFDVTLKAPHGGIFVFFAIGHLLWFVVALAAGMVVAAIAVVAAKQFTGKSDAELEAPTLAAA